MPGYEQQSMEVSTASGAINTTFALSFKSVSTACLQCNASAAEIQTAPHSLEWSARSCAATDT